MPSNWDLDRVERLAKIIGATSIPALGLVVTTLLHQDQQSSREQELKIERERQSQQTAVESENRKQEALESRDDKGRGTRLDEKGLYSIQLKVTEIREDSVRVALNVFEDSFAEETTANGDKRKVLVGFKPANHDPIEFKVSYFDLPFMDNTRLYAGNRFAVVLRDIRDQQKVAELGLVSFREDFMSVRDRPYLTQMLRELGGRAD